MRDAAAHGRFITFEGGEGAGKSTQVAALAAALTRAGIPHLATREPGGSDGAEALRALLVNDAGHDWDPLSELLLILTARRDHLRRRILPALAAGTWVLCDRFSDSTLAYQGHGQGLATALIGKLADLALGDLEAAARRPDLTFVFDLAPAAGLARAAARRAGEDRYEALGTAFHQRVRDGFRAIAAADPARCLLIDAAQDPATVAAAVLTGCRDRLGVALS